MRKSREQLATRPPARRERILILVENLPVPFDRRVWMEATTLRAAGYAVTVICPQGDYLRRHEVIDGISVYRYPLPSLRGGIGHFVEYAIAVPATFLLTCLVAMREGFDVIQSANPPDLFFLVAGFFKPFGKRFVFDHHDPMPEICETRWRGWKGAVLRRLCLAAERATFFSADRVIANNQSVREIAIARGGVESTRIAVVRSAPRKLFQPVAARVEWKRGRPFLVAYLGVMGPNDGLDRLLDAIAHVVITRRRDDVQFVLVGAGDLYDATVARSRELRLEDCVCFTGRVPDAEVVEVLSSADLCVAPDPKDALNDLSSMNKIVEYMAMAKPVVAFDLREVRISADSAGMYVAGNDATAFGDAILELLDAPERRRAMGAAGRQRFEDVLAWEHQQVALLDLYDDLFGRRGVVGA